MLVLINEVSQFQIFATNLARIVTGCYNQTQNLWWGRFRVIMADTLNCNILESDFELQSCY